MVVRNGTVLLVRQRRQYGVHWEFPSGYYDAGESFEQAAAREVREEANVEVEVGELVCTMVWEREQDRRRNLLAYFSAVPRDPEATPAPQVEEDIDAAAYLDPSSAPEAHDIHPMHRAILDRWWPGRANGFHLHVDVLVLEDGRQDYVFR